jgi:hypothetical protein
MTSKTPPILLPLLLQGNTVVVVRQGRCNGRRIPKEEFLGRLDLGQRSKPLSFLGASSQMYNPSPSRWHLPLHHEWRLGLPEPDPQQWQIPYGGVRLVITTKGKAVQEGDQCSSHLE